MQEANRNHKVAWLENCPPAGTRAIVTISPPRPFLSSLALRLLIDRAALLWVGLLEEM